jgi:hypothetical protein
MFRFIGQIGLVNVKLVKTLHIWVPWMADLAPWLQLLTLLAKEAIGLRSIKFGWGANCESSWHLEQERGLGDNLDFVRTLGKIQGLEKLVIEGFYAKNWPGFLERKMAVRVRAICVQEYLNSEGSEDEEFIQKLNETNLKQFREYQQGTESLIP